MENSLFKYIILTEENMAKEHICCAFSDKKCAAGYELKKRMANEGICKWLCFQTA